VSSPVALSARGLRKSYPGVQALRGVDIDLLGGEVHGLVGENGAGKSTLVKVLTGVVAADEGRIRVGDVETPSLDPQRARRHGIVAVHQEPNIVPSLTPVANVFLGQAVTRAGLLREREMRARFDRLVEEMGVRLPATGPAGRLPLAHQQTIEILRAVAQDARVLIMDEPTSSLGPEEREALFGAITRMIERRIAVVFISHKLDDVLAIAHRVTVLRDGRKVFESRASETDPDGLIGAMLGESPDESVLRRHVAPPGTEARHGREQLRARGLTVPGTLHDVDIDVRQGEIVAVAGLVGAGRSTLLRALAGVVPVARGELHVAGRPTRWPRTPRAARRLGIALAPEDRRREGLVLLMSAAQNLTLASPGRDGRFGFHLVRRQRARARAVASRVGFPPARIGTAASTLSGGNQQKLVLGRLLDSRPSVLLLDEPGRGIDVGAKAEIFRLVRSVADAGTAVVLVSEEIEELVALADRVVVMAGGTTTTQLSGAQMTVDRVLGHMLPKGDADLEKRS
jgi:ABC-type sugar transport system ATPase subunit